MSENYLVKGAFISDDYYFVLTEAGIKQLQKNRSIEGIYVCPSNSIANKLLLMKLKVKIVGLGKKYESTDININYEKRTAQYDIHRDAFNEAFINPTSWEKEHGPSWRIVSCNCYILTPKSSQYKNRNQELEKYIIEAKNYT